MHRGKQSDAGRTSSTGRVGRPVSAAADTTSSNCARSCALAWASSGVGFLPPCPPGNVAAEKRFIVVAAPVARARAPPKSPFPRAIAAPLRMEAAKAKRSASVETAGREMRTDVSAGAETTP